MALVGVLQARGTNSENSKDLACRSFCAPSTAQHPVHPKFSAEFLQVSRSVLVALEVATPDVEIPGVMGLCMETASNMGVSENKGPYYSTLNSRTLIIRTQNKVLLIFGKSHIVAGPCQTQLRPQTPLRYSSICGALTLTLARNPQTNAKISLYQPSSDRMEDDCSCQTNPF